MDKLRLLKVTALLLLIFVGGAVSGILLDRHFAPRHPMAARPAAAPPADRPEVLLKEFATAMNLTTNQQHRIGVLLKDWDRDIAAHTEWTRAQRQSFIAGNRPSMVTNLTAEQAVIYDRLVERSSRRRAR